jgi:hypothetical protein
MLESDMETRVEPFLTDEPRLGRMRLGPLASLALHVALVLLLVFGDPWQQLEAPAPVTEMVPINLVRLAEATGSPPAPVVAPLPQEPAKEVAKTEPEKPVPVPATPPPPAAEERAEAQSPPAPAAVTPPSQEVVREVAKAEPETSVPETPSPAPSQQAQAKSVSDLAAPVTPEAKPPPPKAIKAPKLAAAPTAKIEPQPVPVDPLAARLEMLAQLRQPAPPMPSDPRQQEGTGASNVTATSANAARARDASYSVKDFIRAQIERHWNLDGARLKSSDWVVAIHIVLSPDGTVTSAEIVDDPRLRSDSAYHDFALSARNAVLLSSPLTVPPGEYDIARDIVLDFNSKQVSQ